MLPPHGRRLPAGAASAHQKANNSAGRRAISRFSKDCEVDDAEVPLKRA
jgi:hypothetical protein